MKAHSGDVQLVFAVYAAPVRAVCVAVWAADTAAVRILASRVSEW